MVDLIGDLLHCLQERGCLHHPGHRTKHYVRQVPTDIRFYSSEIIEATIYDSKRVSDAAGRLMWLVDARVDRVIKGSINTNTAKILFYDACTLFGGHGTILGELEDNPLWGRVLIPKQHYVR
jgi:hypothetical protein